MKYFLIILLSILSCTQQSASRFDIEMQKANCCGFEQEIHKTKTGGLDPTFLNIRQFLDKKFLQDISNGVDSFEFRVWYPSSKDTNMVFVFKYDKKWQCGVYRHYFEKAQQGDVISQWRIIREYPNNSSFSMILDTLTYNNIFQLKDCQDLNGYVIASPESEVIFELAGNQFYRCLTYTGLLGQSSNIPEVKSAKSIIKFIDREFNTEIVEGLNSWVY